jgi:uncharacterized protein
MLQSRPLVLRVASSVSRRRIPARGYAVKVTQTTTGPPSASLSTTDDQNQQADESELVDSLIDYTSSLMTSSSRHLVAFSGGVDSSLVLALLQQANNKNGNDDAVIIQPVLGISPAVSQEQVDLARQVSAHLGFSNDLMEVYPDEGSDETYIANAGEACFACKTHLYTSLQLVLDHTRNSNDISPSSLQLQQGIREAASLYNGTNADDVLDPTRLGLIAAANFQVRSPLQYTTKDNVRRAAKHLGLPNWNYAASPCLRSRLALGVQATQEHLHMIEAAEMVVKQSLPSYREMSNLRVRLLSKQRARVELDEELVEEALELLPQWTPLFRGLGFASIHDVKTFQSGSVSRPLPALVQDEDTEEDASVSRVAAAV